MTNNLNHHIILNINKKSMDLLFQTIKKGLEIKEHRFCNICKSMLKKVGYFQYPQNTSQIYSKALEYNVCLLSWEHISIMLDKKIKEDERISLESLWNSSQMIARDKTLAFANAKTCFLSKIDGYVAKKIGITEQAFGELLGIYKNGIVSRGEYEIEYWNNRISEVKKYTREEAIEELIRAKKLYEKISVITVYIEKLRT